MWHQSEDGFFKQDFSRLSVERGTVHEGPSFQASAVIFLLYLLQRLMCQTFGFRSAVILRFLDFDGNVRVFRISTFHKDVGSSVARFAVDRHPVSSFPSEDDGRENEMVVTFILQQEDRIVFGKNIA